MGLPGLSLRFSSKRVLKLRQKLRDERFREGLYIQMFDENGIPREVFFAGTSKEIPFEVDFTQKSPPLTRLRLPDSKD